MLNNIIFIGGIHGAGKGIICSEISRILNLEHITASEILKWTDINKNSISKAVKNIPYTQSKLIIGLKQRLKKNHFYLLDGHFCLLDTAGQIIKIPFETFEVINPLIIAVVTDGIQDIKKRLYNRDNKIYDFDTLTIMQRNELDYGKEISQKLNISFIEVANGELTPLVKEISKKGFTNESTA